MPSPTHEDMRRERIGERVGERNVQRDRETHTESARARVTELIFSWE